MFNIHKLTPVINHLRNISPNMFRKTNNEIMLHCCFCDDATRPNARQHGHLYISEEHPVFICQRCNSSGTLISLLLYTGFDDPEVLKFIGQFIKLNLTKDYYKINKLGGLQNNHHELLLQKIFGLNNQFKINNRELFEQYTEYIKERIGDIDYLEFLLTPNMTNQYLNIMFNNYIGEAVTCRYTNHPKYRYIINRKITESIYYFQPIHNDYKNICLCEGPFDIINLYLYNDQFKDNLFIAINSKNYMGVLERLIIRYLLVGSYRINIVFDNDFINYEGYLWKVRNMIGVFSREILLTGWKPGLTTVNDVAEFPSVVEIQGK